MEVTVLVVRHRVSEACDLQGCCRQIDPAVDGSAVLGSLNVNLERVDILKWKLLITESGLRVTQAARILRI
jgi:hypothetical protein